MGQGNFQEPPKGPQVGPTLQYSELSDDKKRELGDLKRVAEESVFKAAPLDPRIAAEEAATTQEQPKQEEKPSEAAFDVGHAQGLAEDPQMQEAVEKLAALQSVVAAQPAEAEDEFRREAMPTTEDKEEFFRTLLGGRRYQKTYELFGGMLTVMMVELTPSEEDHIFAEMGKAQRESVVVTEDDWAVLFERLRLMHSIRKMTRTGCDPYERDVDENALDKIGFKDAEKFVSDLKGSVVYQSLMNVSRLFRAQMDIMVEASTSSDFWKVDGPDSPSQPTSEEPSTTEPSPSQEDGAS